jgi:acetylornithine deacetylase/succinyl-diaminopimelate desuccinylase-like protein
MEQPSVIAAGAELITRINELDQQLSEITDGIAGRESMFIGEVRSGEIYNQAPTEFQLTGTRRWLPGTKHEAVKQQFLDLLKQVEQACPGITATGEFHFVRDAFQLDQEHTVVSNFQDVCTNVMGEPLPIGCKPFVDDGNTFSALKNIPAITHGPNAKGAHTVNEEVPIAELERVALVYALTAISFCNGEQ